MASTWELIDSNFGNIKIKRMRTPFGWLLRTDEGESILYVPDEANLWAKMEKLDFTAIPSSGQNTLLRRAKIPGGWLLARYSNKTSTTYEGDLNRTKDRSLEFVPDPKWDWEIALPKTQG
jgi:hypothetical protein